jgi:hypothetical protein
VQRVDNDAAGPTVSREGGSRVGTFRALRKLEGLRRMAKDANSMREKMARFGVAACLFLGGSLGLSLPLVLRSIQRHPLPQAQAETLAEDKNPNTDAKLDGVDRPYFLWLMGPNDGEPINSRILRLRLETDFPDKGVLNVSVNDTLIPPRDSSLLQNAYRDNLGVLHRNLDIDLIVTGRLIGEDLLHPDAGPIRVMVFLSTGTPSHPVASAIWSKYIGKPWLELLPSTPQNNNDAPHAQPVGVGVAVGLEAIAAVAPEAEMLAAPTTPTVALHTRQKDLFYFLIAATNRDLLASLSPDDPRLFREGRLVDCGPTPSSSPQPPEDAPMKSVSLDSLVGTPWQQGYLVLWTFDSLGAWQRSVILPITR